MRREAAQDKVTHAGALVKRLIALHFSWQLRCGVVPIGNGSALNGRSANEDRGEPHEASMPSTPVVFPRAFRHTRTQIGRTIVAVPFTVSRAHPTWERGFFGQGQP